MRIEIIMLFSPVLSDYDVVAQLIGQGVSAVSTLVALYFLVRAMVLAFVGQMDVFTGRPGALADIVQQGAYIISTGFIAANGPGIAKAIANIGNNNLALLTTDDISNVKVLYTPFIEMILAIGISFVVALVLIGVLFSVLQGQVGLIFGSSGGVGMSILRAISVFAVFLSGLMVMFIGKVIFTNFL